MLLPIHINFYGRYCTHKTGVSPLKSDIIKVSDLSSYYGLMPMQWTQRKAITNVSVEILFLPTQIKEGILTRQADVKSDHVCCVLTINSNMLIEKYRLTIDEIMFL